MHELICSKNQLKEWISYEQKKYGGGYRIIDFFEFSEKSILRKHQRLLRYTEYYLNTHKRMLYLYYRLRLNRIQNRYALHIPVNTTGKGLKIMHVGPILINGSADIGKDLSIHINTSIVAGGKTDNAAIIGDNVIISVGAVVVGGIKIANNVVVGANAVVTRDVNCQEVTIAGVPAKKICDYGSSAW